MEHPVLTQYTIEFGPVIMHVCEVDILTKKFTLWIVVHDPHVHNETHPKCAAMPAIYSSALSWRHALASVQAKLGMVLARRRHSKVRYVAWTEAFDVSFSDVHHILDPGLVSNESRTRSTINIVTHCPLDMIPTW